MLEPENNPNPRAIVDPPRPLRWLLSRYSSHQVRSATIEKRRAAFEKKRTARGQPRVVEYFHQLDDPYSHLTAQVLARFATRYDIVIKPHLVRATGGKLQPEQDKLAVWARRDAELVAPHFGLAFPGSAATTPNERDLFAAASELANLPSDQFIARIAQTSTAMWQSDLTANAAATSAVFDEALDSGSTRLAELGHYSGATFYYGGEWYWGVDRLFHLEQRLRDLGACKDPTHPYIVSRPRVDVSDIDASMLSLHFYPSLNSPYTAIVFDRTLALADSCGVTLHHKPVLPMVMRGVPLTPGKTRYLLFDTKREADFFGVPFGELVFPIGTPTREAYSLLPWARQQGKDCLLMSILLRYSWAEGRGLHRTANLRAAVEAAGLDWRAAREQLNTDQWKRPIEQHQHEMVDNMGLWGVPSYRLSGPDGEPDLSIWGQDRLWLVAAEIRRRAELASHHE